MCGAFLFWRIAPPHPARALRRAPILIERSINSETRPAPLAP
jgi:hypothetical protein